MKKNQTPLYVIKSLLFITAGLFLFTACNNYLINTGIREFLNTYGNATVKINFNANGGEGSMDVQAVKSGIQTPINVNAFTHPDPIYKFVGWNTQADGKGTDYADNAPISITENITLYAKWSDAFWVITLYGNNGAIPNTEPLTRDKTLYVEKTKSITLANIFERSGYTFDKWTTEQGGTGTVYTNNEDLTPNKNMQLHAQWKLAEYTITFLANGGEGTMKAQTVEHNVKEPLEENTFTRTDYAFAGWLDADGNSFKDMQDVTLTQNITLTAQWKKLIKIAFDSNDGTGGTMVLHYANGDGSEEYLPKNNYTKEGHEFVGWNTKADGKGTPFADGGLITFTTSITLYAQWSNNYYTIIYNGNGGEVVNGNGATVYEQYVERGVSAQLKPKTFSKTGTTFVGWNTNQDGSGTTYQNNETVQAISADDILYAQWGYTVSFNTNGGDEIPSQLVIENKTFVTGGSIPPSPTKENSIFEGWYKESGLKNKWDFDTDKVTENRTLYAKWIDKENTITYDANNGSSSVTTQIVTPLVEATLRKNSYTYEGKLFVGWNTVQSGVDGTFYVDEAKITTNADITLYAQWADQLTITFNGNGGDGSMDEQVVGSDIASILKKNTFTHSNSNYTFTGWNTQADGKGTSYADEGEVTISKNTELYAQWASEIWVITYYANGGSVFGSEVKEYTQNVQKESTINLQPNGFSLSGSTFAGWTDNAEGTGTVYVNGQEITPDRDLYLYAKWNRTVTITYNQNFGSNLTQTQEVTEGEATTLNKNLFERERFYFTGWTKQAAGGGTHYTDEQANVSFDDDTELFAQWIIAPYSDTTAKTIVSNGYNLKMVNDGGGSTIKWLYDSKEIALADIGSSNIANGSDVSSYSIINARGEDGNYLQTGDHILEGGSIKAVEGMNTVSIKGNLSVGSNGSGGIVLTKAGQLRITGVLTGSDEGVIVRSHTITQGDVIASVASGGDPTAKLNITNSYGSFAVQVEYKNNQVLALGQLGLTPSENIEWEGDTFSIPDIQLGVSGTIFSISVEGGTFTTGSVTTIEGAILSMGIPVSGSASYVEVLKPNTSYSYVQFFPASGTDTFPAVGANDFVKTLTFTPANASVGMSVKINLETVELDNVLTGTTADKTKHLYFNGSFYKIVTNSNDTENMGLGWMAGYNTAKAQMFNGLQGYLISITSDSENKFIYDKVLLGNYGKVDCWIGGTRLYPPGGKYDPAKWTGDETNEKGDWYWAAGPEAGEIFHYGMTYLTASTPENIELFDSWTATEPNDSGNEECAHYYATQGEYRWNDFDYKRDPPLYSIVEFTPYGSQVADKKAAFAQELYIKQ